MAIFRIESSRDPRVADYCVLREAERVREPSRAPDGVVEAIEATSGGFVLGVQCHPEELWEHTDRRWARMFEAFIAVAQARS